jgi:K+-transporting ATPase ATPase A chain
MTAIGWLQIALFFLAVLVTIKPLGLYMARVFAGERTALSPVLGRLEADLYRVSGISPQKEQGWLAYTVSMLAFSVAGFVVLYRDAAPAVLSAAQPAGLLPAPASILLSIPRFLRHQHQLAVLWRRNHDEPFHSDGRPHGAELRLRRNRHRARRRGHSGVCAHPKLRTIGNFWVDMTRATLYVLLPMAIIVALGFMAIGMPQTLQGSVDGHDARRRQADDRARSRRFSQEAIKQLGTNGGGFFNANAAHPFENPNGLGQLPLDLRHAGRFGRPAGHASAAWWATSPPGQGAAHRHDAILLIAGVAAIYWAEAQRQSAVEPARHRCSPANYGRQGSPLRPRHVGSLSPPSRPGFPAAPSMPCMPRFTPLGGLVPMFLMQLGEILPGGVGSGLYGMIVIALLSVFVAGLMVGRTPEYLGKKIEAREMKLAVLAILVLPLVILGFTAVSAMLPMALSSLANSRSAWPVGDPLCLLVGGRKQRLGLRRSQCEYAWYNTTLGIAMAMGRFAYVIPVMAIAGSLAAKKRIPPYAGELPHPWAAVRRAAHRCHPHPRRPAIFPGSRPWARSSNISPCSPARPSNWRHYMSTKHANRFAVRQPPSRSPAGETGFRQILAAAARPQSGDLRHRRRLPSGDGDLAARSLCRQRYGLLLRPDRRLAVVHRALRQFCRSGGGRPRQGPGRCVAAHPHRHGRPQAAAARRA